MQVIQGPPQVSNDLRLGLVSYHSYLFPSVSKCCKSVSDLYSVIPEPLQVLLGTGLGKVINTMEQWKNRLEEVEKLKEEKGKRLKALEDSVRQLQAPCEASGSKRARGSMGGW